MQIRTTKPEAGNKYYVRKANGGYNPCIQGKPLDSGCNVLANCVGYAVGRFNEEINAGSCKYMASMNAENFYANAYKWGCKVGQIPVQGAIMCWAKGKPANSSDGAGHVAIVERVDNQNQVFTSESGYNSFIFKNRTRTKGSGNWGSGSGYTFLGFIYNPELPMPPEIKPVERDINKDQLKTLVYLNVRTGAGTNYSIVGQANTGSIFNYYETKENGGYVWYRIEENQWVAQDKDKTYLEIMPREKDYKELYEEELAKNEKLELDKKDLQAQLDVANKKLEDIKVIVNS